MALMASANFYTNFTWYSSIGYQGILLKTLVARGALFGVTFITAGVFFAINLFVLRNTLRHRIVGSTGGNIRYFPSGQPWLESLDDILSSNELHHLSGSSQSFWLH